MSSGYPAELDALATDLEDSTPQQGVHAAHHNDLADAVNNVEAELGVNPSGLEGTVAERLDAAEDDATARLVDHGYIVQRYDDTVISASQWVPLYGALVPCNVRDVALLPKTGFGGAGAVYWEGRLAVSRFFNNNPVPVVAPVAGAITGIDPIATRRADGGANAITAGQLWRFASMDWDEAKRVLGVGDVLGIWWEKVGVAANLAWPLLYSMRMTAVG